MRNRTARNIAAMAALVSFGCPGEDPAGGGDVGGDPDASLDVSVMTDTGPPDTGAPDTGTPDTGTPDSGTPDSGTPDGGGDASDMGEDPNYRTLSDYYGCESDSDCPVGLGSCVTDVPLNRPDVDGATSIPVADLLPGLSSSGVCTEVCTSSDAICSTLTMQGDSPDPEPWTCQLIGLGQLPYPGARPAFPFNDQLDPDEQALGRAFGAVCRPPFGLDPDVSDTLCSSCDGDAACGADSACVDLGTLAAVEAGDQGTCAPACAGAADCPGGFECADVEGTNRCLPVGRSCTSCKDHDFDGYGDGRCGGADGAVTSHDCDDLDPLAYFDTSIPNHPFPMYCGEHDYNCNGFSDDAEQIGAFAFPEDHCTSCGDVCEGALQDAQRGCKNRNVDGVDQPVCIAVCDTDSNDVPTHADCDGDINNGCEVAINDPNNVFYRDHDGDGWGDLNNSIFDCAGSGEPPDGYVRKRSDETDCEDNNDAKYPGNTEICDGLDNDCNGETDEDGLSGPNAWPDNVYINGDSNNRPTTLTTGVACGDNRRHGICVAGVTTCFPSTGRIYCAETFSPNDQTEACGDDIDNDCDGATDEGGPDSIGTDTYYRDQDEDGFALDTAQPELLCPNDPAVLAGDYTRELGDCEDNNAAKYPGNTEICDGFDNDCNGETDEDGLSGPSRWPDNVYINGDPSDRPTILTTGVACGDNRRHGICVAGVTTCFPSDGNIFCSETISAGSQSEVCGDTLDNDCDGNVDEGGPDSVGTQDYYYDNDMDGYALDTAVVAPLCPNTPDSNSGVFTQQRGDCNDTTALASPAPGRFETCDLLDNQCNGRTDEGCPTGHVSSSGHHTQGGTHGFTNTGGAFASRAAHCPAGKFVTNYKLYVEYGTYSSINGMYVDCDELEVYDRNQPTGNKYDVRVKAGTGTRLGFYGTDLASGDSEFNKSCGAGEVMTGLSGHHAPQRVTGYTAKCHDLTVSSSPGNPVNTSIGRGSINELSFAGTNPNNATDFNESCPPGEAISGLNIWTGPWFTTHRIRGVQVRCSKIDVTVAP